MTMRRASAWTAPWPPAPVTPVNIHPKSAKMVPSCSTPSLDNLLLFFHHAGIHLQTAFGSVRYSVFLRTATTGAQRRRRKLEDEWTTLKGKIDPLLFACMERARLEYQAGHAIEPRDAIVQYFLKQSGIPDDQGRAGHFPVASKLRWRVSPIYKVVDVTPWEDASGGKAVSCNQSSAQPFRSSEW